MTSMSALMGNYNNRDEFWFINYDGEVTSLTREEAQILHPNTDFSDDSLFWFRFYGTFFYDNSGFYSFVNVNEFITLEELMEHNPRYNVGRGNIFHIPALIYGGVHAFLDGGNGRFLNPEEHILRNGRFLDTNARMMRWLINEQVVDAIANPHDISYILRLLSTFVYYRENHHEDYVVTSYFDRNEGMAQWLDWVSALLVAYRPYIENDEDLHDVFVYMARNHREDTWLTHNFGAVLQSYMVGALTAVLLDRHMDRFEWQIKFEREIISPLQILLEHFEDYELPPFSHVFTQNEIDEILRLKTLRLDDVVIYLDDFLHLIFEQFPNEQFEIYEIEKYLSGEDFEELGEEWHNYLGMISINREIAENIVSHIISRPVNFSFVEGQRWTFGDLGEDDREGPITFVDAYNIIDYLANLNDSDTLDLITIIRDVLRKFER